MSCVLHPPVHCAVLILHSDVVKRRKPLWIKMWKTETWEEHSSLRRKKSLINRKRGMKKGTLCKYQQAYYHFKTLGRKSQKVERSIISGNAKSILAGCVSVFLCISFKSSPRSLIHTFALSPAFTPLYFSVCGCFFSYLGPGFCMVGCTICRFKHWLPASQTFQRQGRIHLSVTLTKVCSSYCTICGTTLAVMPHCDWLKVVLKNGRIEAMKRCTCSLRGLR